jgi:hypothetical protein
MIREYLRTFILRAFIWQNKLLGPEPGFVPAPPAPPEPDDVQPPDMSARFWCMEDGMIVQVGANYQPFVVATASPFAMGVVQATYRNPYVGPVRWQ